jgi:hypothetical protein
MPVKPNIESFRAISVLQWLCLRVILSAPGHKYNSKFFTCSLSSVWNTLCGIHCVEYTHSSDKSWYLTSHTDIHGYPRLQGLSYNDSNNLWSRWTEGTHTCSVDLKRANASTGTTVPRSCVVSSGVMITAAKVLHRQLTTDDEEIYAGTASCCYMISLSWAWAAQTEGCLHWSLGQRCLGCTGAHTCATTT